MTLLVSWLIFPLVLGLIALGCGLLLEWASGARLPGVLLLPAGLALMVVVGLFTIISDPTADITTPVLVVLAMAGFVLSPPWRKGSLDVWAIACVVAVYATYASPIVLSGDATFAGYFTQVDTGTWLGLTDHIMDHGRSLSGLGDSIFKDNLELYLPVGYPLGAFVPLGTGHELIGQDLAYLFQPYLAFVAGMLALSLYYLSADLVPSRPLRALACYLASQPALLFAFSLWSGIKELSGASLLALLAALVALAVRQGARGRALLPLSVVTAAVLGLFSFAGGVWLVPPLALALVLSIRLHGRATALAQAAFFLAFVVALSIPSLADAGSFYDSATSGVITGEELGLLLFPLSWRQAFGIWPAGDFRTVPEDIGLVNVLIAFVVVAAVAGLLWAWRRRNWELLLYAVGTGITCLIVTRAGSAWVDSKALALASPAIVLTAMVGAFAIPGRGRRVGGTVLAVTIAGGVLWSNLLAYHDVTLAPADRLHELERVSDRIAGQGPTLFTSWDPYASRHFFKAAEVQGPSGRLVIPARGGGFSVAAGRHYVDIEEYDIVALLDHRTIVRRRSPTSDRPPSVYRLVWSGRYYEMWQRPVGSEHQVLHSLALRTGRWPAGKPSCRDVLSLAAFAGLTGRLAIATQRPQIHVGFSSTPVWERQEPGEAVPRAVRSGKLEARVRVPETGRYSAWISGSFHRRVQLFVDGRPLTEPRREFNPSSSFYVFMGDVSMRGGPHTVELRFDDEGVLHAGTGGDTATRVEEGTLAFGPLILTRAGEDSPVTYVKASRARTLCAKNLDWVEVVSPTSTSG